MTLPIPPFDHHNNNNNCEFDLQGSCEHYQPPPALARAATPATPAPWLPLTLGPCSLCGVGVTVLVPQGLGAGWAWEADGLPSPRSHNSDKLKMCPDGE